MSDRRLDNPLSPSFKRSRPVRLTFDGNAIEAFDGEPAAAAILASGRHVIARSIKNHRPRTAFCFQGKCGWCLMAVNSVPNVRTCETKAVEGLRLESQNAFPNVNNDTLGVLDRVSGKTPAGFQYETFLQPRFMRKTYLNLMRKFTGLGKVSKTTDPPPKRTFSTRECDIVVVGGGIAGIAASTEAANLGSRIILIDENVNPGETLRRRADDLTDLPGFEPAPAYVIADKLAYNLGQAGVEVLRETSAVGCYDDHSLGAVTQDGLIKFRYGQLIIATGAYDRPIMFESNELPGVYGGTAVEILVSQYGIKPGLDTVIVGDNLLSLRILELCKEAKIRIRAILTSKEQFSPELQARAQHQGIEMLATSGITRTLGSGRVETAEICEIMNNKWIRETTRKIECDFISVCQLQPTYELQFQAGCTMRYDVSNGGFLTELDEFSQASVPGVFVAGDAAGIKNDRFNYLQGKMVGIAAASQARSASPGKMEELKAYSAILTEHGTGIAETYPDPVSEKCYVCPCEDVTEAEVTAAIRKGYDQIEHLKRYTGVGTGICQGKYCVTRLAEILGRELGLSAGDVRIPTQRPPVKSLQLDCYVVEASEPAS